MADRRGVLVGQPWLRAWLGVAIAAWVTLGVLLVTRANNQGLVDDLTISPYHLVGYAALLVLAAWVGSRFFRALRHGRVRRAFPPLYGGLALGLVLLLAWVVLDPIWRGTLGIRPGIEIGLSPTRLLVPIALLLLASGPVREAIALRAERGLQPGERRIRWAGVVATGLLGGALTLAAFNPIQTPISDWSYLPSRDNSEIWAMNPDGSEQTRILTALGDGVDYSLPAWSPDGTRIAYTTWTNEGGAPVNIRNEDQNASIWTMAVDGSDRRMIVDGGDDQAWVPAWSPDGQWLTYTLTPLEQSVSAPPQPQANAGPGQAGPPAAVEGASIWIVRADGTDGRRLTPEGLDGFGATWAPSGSRIAYYRSGGGAPGIHVATVTEAGLVDDVPIGSDALDAWGITWSRDGAWIAYSSHRSGNDEVYVIDAGGVAPPKQLTDHDAGDWVPAFSPDGSRILFVSDRSGEAEIWSMAADGSDQRNVTNHPQHHDGLWSVSWAPDGSRVAYGNASFQDPVTSGWVREDLAAAQAILFGVALAALALVVLALGAPVGSFGAVLLVTVLAGAIPVDGWRYLPAAFVAGLAVDGLVRAVPARWKARAAATALPAFGTLAIGVTIAVAGTLAWSLTLLLGTAMATGAIGFGLAEAGERLLGARSNEVAPSIG